MPSPESLGHYEAIVSKEKLRPGYVLNQTIASIPGMRRGLVLSQNDIEAIQKFPQIDFVRVLTQEKVDVNEKKSSDGKSSQSASPLSTVYESGVMSTLPEYGEDELFSSVFDLQADRKVSKLVEMKKSHIRGPEYDERIQEMKQRKLDTFNDALRTVQAHLRQETIEIFEHFARTSVDFEGIASLPGVNRQTLMSRLDLYEENVSKFINAVLTEKKVYSSYVENIVIDVVRDVGYRLQLALFAAVSRSYKFLDFLTAHALQVLIVSLVTAIELTRIINQKINSFGEKDINLFLSMGKKSFTIEELVNLGIAALLHDIALKKQLPDMGIDHHFDIHQQAQLDLHPSNGFHICRDLNLDFEVQRAVYQHHERFDGSGYPNGLMPRFFTKYTPVLMFAEYYVEQTTTNPFIVHHQHPRDAVIALLNKHALQFDGDVVYSFVKAASLFPVGSWLLLSNGFIGMVTGFQPDELSRPQVKIYFDKSLRQVEAFSVDLAIEPITVLKPIDSKIIQKVVMDSMANLFAS